MCCHKEKHEPHQIVEIESLTNGHGEIAYVQLGCVTFVPDVPLLLDGDIIGQFKARDFRPESAKHVFDAVECFRDHLLHANAVREYKVLQSPWIKDHVFTRFGVELQ